MFSKNIDTVSKCMYNKHTDTVSTYLECDKTSLMRAVIQEQITPLSGTLPIIGVTKENHVLDAVKAANVTLTAEETAELEKHASAFLLLQS